MLISLLVYAQIIYVTAEVHNGPIYNQSDHDSQHIWHSYIFNTGAGNREELQFSNVGLDKNFASSDGEFMWKSLQVQEEIVIVGLGTNFLLVTTYTNENDSFTYKEDLQGSAVYVTMFQKWDVKSQQIKSFIVVALDMTENNYMLKWYEIGNRELKFLWDWPFHRIITHIDVIKINQDSKLLIVSHKNGEPKNPSADIYSFNLGNYLDMWLFEKIILDEVPSSVAVFDSSDYTFLSASFPSLEMIHIFKYSKSLCLDPPEQKHFMSHQKIFATGLKSLITFRVGFRWYLAVASRTSSIYIVRSESLLFEPVNNLKLGSFNYLLALPVDTYREDTILLADSDSDVSIIAWKGDENLEVVGSFIQKGCNEDPDCLDKMNGVSLKGSTAFDFNGHQSVIMSTENGSPLVFKLRIKLNPLSDRVTLRLNEILNEKSMLEKNFKDQKEEIDRLLTMSKKSKEKMDGDEAESQIVLERPETPGESLSLTKNWTEILSAVSRLRGIVNGLSFDLEKIKKELKSNSSANEGPEVFLRRNVTDGITFYGNVLIKELDLSTINGRDAGKLLKDSFRRSKPEKIGGKKTLKSLKVENVLFDKIEETLACDIVFSDDDWDDNKHVINGDVVWEGKLNVLHDVVLLSKNASSGKVNPKGHKRFYDTLNVDELEVTGETYVQETVNGQPFILPVHNGHFNINYLDIVNQARVEIVNVEKNLNIDFINGKNLSRLLKGMTFKKGQRKEWDKIKVEGVFSASDVQTNRLNSLDLSRERNPVESDEVDSNKLISEGDLTYFGRDAGNSLKRTIHVFYNLEVAGTVFSEKINNLDWDFLNDTVKKNENSSDLSGIKTFRKPLGATEVSVRGTLNGRFVENVLTNRSDQVIRFAQSFNKVSFKNVSLAGVWDRVCVECLNRTAVRLFSAEHYASNLTFEGDCEFNNLNVLSFVNDVPVKETHQKRENNKMRMKTIKAPRVVLHGSLLTNHKINDMNLTDFDLLRVSLRHPQTVDRDMSQDNLTVTETLNLVTVNGNDVSSIIDSRGDTKVIGKFLGGEIERIKKLLVKGNVSTAHGINGVNVSEILENGIRITKANAIPGNIVFEDLIHFNDINVTNSIEGFSLKDLEKDIAFKQGHVFLSGEKNFSTIRVTKDMKVRSLNGHLIQDVVTLKGDQTMKGPVEIHGDVVVSGNITSYGAINGITVPNLLKTYSTRFNSYIFSGDLILRRDMVTVDNLFVDGNIQDISLEALIGNSIARDESFNATGKKLFKGEVKFKENISVEGSINGLNFSDFVRDVVFIHKPAKLRGVVTMTEAVLKVLETADYFNSTLINNFNTNDWLEDSVPLDRYQLVSGKKIFDEVHALEDVSVDFINGHLPSATISLKGKQFIPSLALFPRVHSASDVTVTGSVNDRNLVEEFEDTVLLIGNQTIDGRTVFNKDFFVNGRLLVDTIRGKPVDRLITLDTEQTITTPLEFTGVVTARKDVERLKFINNISLRDWSEKSVSLDSEQVLSGVWTVRGKVKTKNVEGDGLLERVSLASVSRDVRKGRVLALELKNETEVEYKAQCGRLKELSRDFERFPYLFHQFEIAQEIETFPVIDSVIPFKINNVHHLIITFANECLSSLYRWNEDKSLFTYEKKMNIGPVNKWLVAYRGGGTYLVTSYLKNAVSCERDLLQGNVWLFDGEAEKYAHLVTTNAFVDVAQENDSSERFYTLDEAGRLSRWTFEEDANVSSVVLMTLEHGSYRFVDFRLTGGLAVTNGREIKQIKGTVLEGGLSFANGNVVALPLEDRVLAAVLLKDKIVIYENLLEEKIFSVIHTYRAGSVLWLNFGPGKQSFLVFASHHKLIEVYEYKSVSGLVKKQSIQMFSSKLQSMVLPSKEKYQESKFLVVIQKRKMIFLRADMLGDFFQGNDSLC